KIMLSQSSDSLEYLKSARIFFERGMAREAAQRASADDIAGWCELRQDFRMFRADRILEAALLADRYPGKRRELVKQW
ncbi:WYL domain-containing protein, partial [Rhizobium leguminosarum]|uniref:WYL domain-containing protein n=1 Tax=Rhizobium leguminosarum TaxID=384 RepID=UPI003F993030